jgi:hypothetical protein
MSSFVVVVFLFMNTNWPFIGIFILGIFLQVFLSINFFADSKKSLWSIAKALGLSLIFPLISLLLTQEDSQKTQYAIIFITWCVLFGVSIMVFFKNEIVPMLNEQSLLVINLITLYLAIKSNFPFVLLCIYLSISTLIIINALVPRQPKRWQEVAFFAWYFILIITIPIAHFNYVELYNNLIGKTANSSVVLPLALGMTFCFVLIHLWFLFEFIPYRHEGESAIGARMRKEEIKSFFASKYEEDVQLHPLGALLLIAVVAGLLIANYYFWFVSDSLIIIITIVASSVFARQKSVMFANKNI